MNGQGQSNEIINNLLFPKIFQTFRIAIQPGKLIVAFFAFALICLAGWLMDLTKTVVVSPVAQGNVTELQVYFSQPERVPLHITGYKNAGNRTGVFSVLWNFTGSSFQDSVESLFTFNIKRIITNTSEFIKALGWAFKYHFFYSISLVTIIFIVISFCGGAICRFAALQFTKGEKGNFFNVLQYSRKNFTSFFAAPLAPLGVIVLIGLVISILGLLSNIPYAGEFTMAFLFLPALMGGLIIAALLILTIAGFNLMYPAVACDHSDFFDAICKSFIYVFSKPWRMGLYSVIAAVYGAICYTFIRFCIFLLFSATYLFLQLSIWVNNSTNETSKLSILWPEPQFENLLREFPSSASANWTELAAAVIIYLSLLVVIGLLVAFVISFYFSANTIIYTLMRNKVDNTALTEVYIGPSAEKTA